jgi:hypothetical protein
LNRFMAPVDDLVTTNTPLTKSQNPQRDLCVPRRPPRDRSPVVSANLPHPTTGPPRHHNNPLAKCGCKKHCMDFHGDHTSTCTAHSGATKAHDWMVGSLGPHGRTHGPTQHGVTARPTARRRGDPQLPPRRSGLPEPGLRPVHDPRPFWEQ